MTKGAVLAVGGFSDTETQALKADFGAQVLPGWEAAAALPTDTRAAVRAVAYKGHAPFGAAQMDLVPGLGLIANFGVGYDAIDVGLATARGVTVTNTPDVLNDDVADLAVALLLAQGRRLVQGSDWVRSGNWAARGEMALNRKVSGGRAGILGLGRIGREIADRLAGFKMEIHYWSRSPKDVPPGWVAHDTPQALAGAVDYLIVALVGGAATENMVSREVIAALGPRGVLVNISRGSTVDEGALLEALEQGALGGAALDVFRGEPRIDPRFLALDTVVVQPHQGSGTVETRAAMAKLQRDNIAAFLAGQGVLTAVN